MIPLKYGTSLRPKDWLMIYLLFAVFQECIGAPSREKLNEAEADDEDVEYWIRKAQEDLKAALELGKNENVARNVILFIGDGMGITTVTAARILKGQLKNKTGEEEQLVFEKFPYASLIKTYGVNVQGPDSAGTATAFLSGVKTRSGVIGVGPSVPRSNCSAQKGAELPSILDWSLSEGKSVGIVTTTRVTHATPAAAYAHSASRSWEGDASMSSVTGDCDDIALQLVQNNSDIQVVLGGGRRFFIPNHTPDPVTGKNDTTYGRRDSRNLIEEWKQDKANRNKSHSFVLNKEELASVDANTTDFLFGLFSTTHLDYEVFRDQSPTGQPSLAEMTEKAIQILQKNDKGFFLLVEGGRIDHGHHGSRAKRALYETVEFDKAIERALEMTDQSETLMVVTADHSHVFAFGGYQPRGNPILGLYPGAQGTDGLPYTTLLYGNGPGHTSPRANLTGVDIESSFYRQQSVVPLSSETHGSEDVSAYAIGPMAHLLHGVKEQSYIPHAMAYAACVGANKNHCNRTVVTDSPHPASTPASTIGFLSAANSLKENSSANIGIAIVIFALASLL